MRSVRVLSKIACVGLSSLLAIACTRTTTTPPTTAPVEASPSPPTPTHVVDREHLKAGLDAYLDAFGEGWGPAFRYSGFVLVTQGDEILYQRALGYADRSAQRPADIDTSFRVGSVTKQFTAAAILRLREQGKLELSDTVGEHLPAFPEPGASVTIHQLLTHTSGVWSYTSDPALMDQRAEPHTVQQMLEMFWDRPLDFPPGSEFRYSNSGYIVLGAIIEAASGVSYGEFLRRELFEPAGMQRTEYGDHEGLDNRAVGYEATPMETVEIARPIDMSVPFAAGGIRSTARDLWKWHRALSGDAILGEESKALLYTPDKSDYAYGWGIGDWKGHRVISHGGGIDGFITDFRRLVDEDIVLVAWSNAGPQSAQVEKAVIPLVFGEDAPPPPVEPTPAPFDPSIGPTVAGSYVITDEARERLGSMGMPAEVVARFERIEIGHDEHSLIFDPIGQPPGRLHPRDNGTFFTKQMHAPPSVTFDRPEGAERARGLWVQQGMLRLRFERTDAAPENAKASGKTKTKTKAKTETSAP